MALGFLLIAALTHVGSEIFSVVWTATFGSAFGITSVLQIATPLILAACAVAIGRQVGLWNIGVDGQLYFGAWAAAAVAFSAPSLPSALMIPLCLLAAFIGGALYGLIPALLRMYLGVSEILTTLMFTFMAPLWIAYWATGPWGTGNSQDIASKELSRRSDLPQFSLGSLTIGAGFLIAIVVCVFAWLAFRYSEAGFRARLVGSDEITAEYAGINVAHSRTLVFLVSAGVAGLAGGTVMLDQVHNVSLGLSSNTGFLAVVVAVLALSSPLACIPMGVVLAGIVTATLALQLSGVSPDAALLLFGLLIIVGGLADVIARYRFVRVSEPSRANEPPAELPDNMDVNPEAVR